MSILDFWKSKAPDAAGTPVAASAAGPSDIVDPVLLRQAVCLRPIDTPEAQAAFKPLWDQRNAVMEVQGEVTELMFAAARRGDTAAYIQHSERLEVLKLEEERLSRDMRDHQFEPSRAN
jgi:hypothetical protein